MPWRTLAIFFVPFAGLAAATGMQRWFEGPAPSGGDPLLRWLLFASVAGLFAGGGTGIVLGGNRAERYGWTFWGIVGPWCVTVAVTGLLVGALKVEERWAARELEACRVGGRSICTPGEFRLACAGAASADAAIREGAVRGLGAPIRRICDQGRCRSQWSYDGPWAAEGSTTRQICAVVGDGREARWMVLAGGEE
jgi:hypothetical protein